jgi:hypothetical protein
MPEIPHSPTMDWSKETKIIEPLEKYKAQPMYQNIYDGQEILLEKIVEKINEIIKKINESK